MKVLVTGAAGFIGAFLCKKLLETTNNQIIGVDNLNDYYDVSLKEARLKMLENKNFTFIKGDISNKAFIDSLFKEYKFDIVVNLAAQAGVRYSIEHPDIYIQSNIIGFYNILEACRYNPVKHLVYASSSSVYGTNEKIPYSVEDCCLNYLRDFPGDIGDKSSPANAGDTGLIPGPGRFHMPRSS